jgi:sortase A
MSTPNGTGASARTTKRLGVATGEARPLVTPRDIPSSFVISRILGAVGRILIAGGVLTLLFVAYQLWGTGLQEARSQEALAEEFAEQLATVDPPSTTEPPAPSSTTTTVPEGGETPAAEPEADLPLPATGEPIAKIRIPSIGVNRTVVESVLLSQLKRGPGHYPETPLPGQKGNVAIAGHRTTYGQPFHNFDKVEVGDEILFETLQGDFTYEVSEITIVEPDQVEILEDKGDDRVTLIACHPKYSAAQRIIVIGKLVDEPVPFIDGQDEYRADAAEIDQSDPLADVSLDTGLSGEQADRTPAILWGLAAAAVWAMTWLAQVAIRRRTRAQAADAGTTPTRAQRLMAYSPYLIGVPVFLVVLYVFFENFALLLPANF